MPEWSDVVAAGRRLPEVEEGTWFRTPCLRVRKKSFCRMKEDGETLVVRVVDLEDKDALLRGQPDVFFTTPHYDGYAYVLVRLAVVERAQLAELIEDAWRLVAPKRLSPPTTPAERGTARSRGRRRPRPPRGRAPSSTAARAPGIERGEPLGRRRHERRARRPPHDERRHRDAARRVRRERAAVRVAHDRAVVRQRRCERDALGPPRVGAHPVERLRRQPRRGEEVDERVLGAARGDQRVQLAPRTRPPRPARRGRRRRRAARAARAGRSAARRPRRAARARRPRSGRRRRRARPPPRSPRRGPRARARPRMARVSPLSPRPRRS